MPDNERRSFFRVDHEVCLDYKPVDAYSRRQHSAEEHFPLVSELNLMAEFRQLDTDSNRLLRNIGDAQRDLADYLSVINQKVNLLSRQLLANQLQHQQSVVAVNISEGGIAFLTDKAIYKDSQLALRIIFLSSYTGIAIYAQVIRCEPVQDGNFRVAVKFNNIPDAQRQLLSKQLLQIQLEEKRRKQG